MVVVMPPYHGARFRVPENRIVRELIRHGGEAVEGPWDGEEAITLLPDLDTTRGAMTGVPTL
jgi:hypothetical protein